MLKITNKQTLAIGITPRIDEYSRDRIQELLDGTHPMSRKTYDTGTKRKTILDPSPLGPNETAEEPADKTSHENVGSGYKEDSNPGARADEETGPGNTSNPDREQDFAGHENADLTFESDSDPSSQWSPLNYESNERDRNSTDHLRRLHRQPPIVMPLRSPVDKLTQRKAWSHMYNEDVSD